MDYFQSLEKLRREIFAEEPAKKPVKTTGFVPQRTNTPVEDSRDLASRPQEWLKQIKAASADLKTTKTGGGFAAGLADAASNAIDKKTQARKDAEAEAKDTSNKEKLYNKRGDTPSTYAPDRKLSANKGTIDLGGKEDFIAAIYPTAIEVGKATGVDPRIIVAQAALESGWGKSAPNNNYFGVKSHGKGGGATMSTKEVVDGKVVTENASFRQYDSPADSVRGYGEFLMENPRYKPMREASSLEEQIQALGRSGYATDPAYADKIYSIATGLPPLSDDGEISFVAPKKSPLIKRRGK